MYQSAHEPVHYYHFYDKQALWLTILWFTCTLAPQTNIDIMHKQHWVEARQNFTTQWWRKFRLPFHPLLKFLTKHSMLIFCWNSGAMRTINTIRELSCTGVVPDATVHKKYGPVPFILNAETLRKKLLRQHITIIECTHWQLRHIIILPFPWHGTAVAWWRSIPDN